MAIHRTDRFKLGTLDLRYGHEEGVSTSQIAAQYDFMNSTLSFSPQMGLAFARSHGAWGSSFLAENL